MSLFSLALVCALEVTAVITYFRIKKDNMFFARIFRRKVMKAPVRTLRIDGTMTTLTPKPDDAELAAQALLESKLRPTPGPSPEGMGVNRKHAEGTLEYYQDLSEKIKAAHEQERRAAMRYVAYVEEQLSTPLSTQGGAGGGSLERGLYQHQDAVEREGGELKQRWQKCLAELTVMEMESLTASAENQEINNEENKTN